MTISLDYVHRVTKLDWKKIQRLDLSTILGLLVKKCDALIN
jgi:hypothetical protein